ncbi:unnamed protein product, partial [Phaeothamnion confervicola]
MEAAPSRTVGGSQTSVVYASESPAALPSKRPSKYRELPTASAWAAMAEEDDILAGTNIMFDRRVVRGNTYAAQVITPSAAREAERYRAEHERRMRAEALRRRQEAVAAMAPRTPPPVAGRAHADMQTAELLEQLADRAPESDARTQTDALMDRPPSPLFVPAKSGTDAETQVLPGELFDFDAEVEPLLEVLIGKTLELSVLECCEEDEMAAIRLRQKKFRQERDAELAEVQRVEAEAQRRFAEKNRRAKQAAAARAAREVLRDKVAARAFARALLRRADEDAFETLAREGHFVDPLRREVQEVFLPWLIDGAAQRVDAAAAARAAADGTARGVLARAVALHAEAEAARQRGRDR